MNRVSIKQLDAIVILDNDGKRIAVKYYDNALTKIEEREREREKEWDKEREKERERDKDRDKERSRPNDYSELNKETINYNNDDIYNNLKTVNDQKLFESDITEKVKRLGFSSSETEVLILNKYIILCLCINDINIYVIGSENDNEIILHEIIQTVYQSLNNITNNQIGKRQLIDKLDSVYLILDEIADSGIILETNPDVIINRLYMHEGDIHEHTALNQAISSAKENIIRSLLSGT